ncbi:MAG TPA: HepT-like ribonuclease domain-containing protein [Chthonomonadaceae bacterium]|nr:HepT-like ribonuclease domain-containing protein [Chthonomonadaceae bacterium]
MRRDSHLLEDIRLAAEDIAAYTAGMRLADFLGDSKTQAAVERQLIIVGEAANRLSAEFRAQHPEIPWKRLTQIRNFYVHGYERLRPEDVWRTAKRFIPGVGRVVAALIPPDEDEQTE